ncbi:TetR/AcrR family transcriptional regulator [Nonomuraea sediminis]|uniref:TetR/AcrR family transcriptional regulator n=1 Tax=Nonomuraea sediminis TaxID=2835864 RepID=UPI001BDC4ED7|nr:TetR/AcrR family transcriptional regulator [Nonomuraea sediminis]
MGIDTLGLREQKKRETRQAISDHATQLFLQRGFDKTTIADIANAARVAKMTVTNYFPRKEDLALDHHEAFVASLADAVGDRAPGESALAAVRRAFMEALERRDPVIGFTGREFARMIADSPTLVARLRDLHEQREAALAAVLVHELTPSSTSAIPGGRTSPGTAGPRGPVSPSPDAPEPGSPLNAPGAETVTARAVAAQLAATGRLLFRELQTRTLAGESPDTIAAALQPMAEQVFDLLEPSIGTYATR